MSITVSTVTPVYCGREYLEALADQLEQLREKWSQEKAPIKLLESIFVDDGSSDGSSHVLSELADKYSWVTVITLSRNYGQHAATVAGICHTKTDWVVTLDEDLQHPPSAIEQLLAKAVQNYADVVYAKPTESVHGNSWRDKSSRWAKTIIAKATNTPQIKSFNSFRLVRGNIARAAASSSSSDTYLDIAITWFTKSTEIVTLDLHDERFTKEQESGYSLSKLIKHARRLIVSSEVDIASSGLVMGVTSILIAGGIGLFSLFQRIFFPSNVDLAGWASLITALTFFSGIIIAFLCVLLEYVRILVLNNLGRPTFFTVDRSADRTLMNWFNDK